jgi:hypothetical protein
MSVTRLREIIWIVSCLLTVGLGWYVREIIVVAKAGGSIIDTDEVTRTLQDVDDYSGPKQSLVDTKLIRKTFWDFDWSGKPEPVVVEAPEVEPVDAGPVYTPVSEILAVYFMQEDRKNPERSRAFVFYDSSSGVTGEEAELGSVLNPGDALSDPYGNVSVKSITIAEGITFQFEEEGREDESIKTEEFQTDLVIPKVDADKAIRSGVIAIPQGRQATAWSPTQTTLIGSDTYQLGSQDAVDLGENYAHYLANEVRHRRHRDPQTGKFDGIEIQSVTSGSIASRHGAAEGDVIRSINGHPVTSVSEAITFVKNHEEEYSVWEVIISNRGVERTVTYHSSSDG